MQAYYNTDSGDLMLVDEFIKLENHPFKRVIYQIKRSYITNQCD